MTTMAFQYLEIRPCIEDYMGTVESFVDEIEFEARRATMHAEDKAFWSLYGVYPLDVGAGAVAPLESALIGDFDSKASALVILNALLAPMVRARERLEIADRFDVESETLPYLMGVATAQQGLTDFINQSSNHERL